MKDELNEENINDDSDEQEGGILYSPANAKYNRFNALYF